ncbi:hypothetical protein SXCC_01348 [Gluconacetobacter sp. SXCC-1]|nr:hypothetical protein SXCC_01348 [Gluconacetobacter sp. SXCC-1]
MMRINCLHHGRRQGSAITGPSAHPVIRHGRASQRQKYKKVF